MKRMVRWVPGWRLNERQIDLTIDVDELPIEWFISRRWTVSRGFLMFGGNAQLGQRLVSWPSPGLAGTVHDSGSRADTALVSQPPLPAVIAVFAVLTIPADLARLDATAVLVRV